MRKILSLLCFAFASLAASAHAGCIPSPGHPCPPAVPSLSGSGWNLGELDLWTIGVVPSNSTATQTPTNTYTSPAGYALAWDANLIEWKVLESSITAQMAVVTVSGQDYLIPAGYVGNAASRNIPASYVKESNDGLNGIVSGYAVHLSAMYQFSNTLTNPVWTAQQAAEADALANMPLPDLNPWNGINFVIVGYGWMVPSSGVAIGKINGELVAVDENTIPPGYAVVSQCNGQDNCWDVLVPDDTSQDPEDNFENELMIDGVFVPDLQLSPTLSPTESTDQSGGGNIQSGWTDQTDGGDGGGACDAVVRKGLLAPHDADSGC